MFSLYLDGISVVSSYTPKTCMFRLNRDYNCPEMCE